MKTNTNLGELIFNKREEMGLSREELAGLLGLDKRTIYYWEDFSDERKPKLVALFKLAKIFNIPIDDMLYF